MSIQTLASIGTQTWPSAVSQAQMTLWPQVTAQVIQFWMAPAAVRPLDTNEATSCCPDPRPLSVWALVATWPMDFRTGPGCSGTIDLDTGFGSSSGLDVIMAPGGSEDHPDRHGPSVCIVLGHQHSPRWWPRPLESARPPPSFFRTGWRLASSRRPPVSAPWDSALGLQESLVRSGLIRGCR